MKTPEERLAVAADALKKYNPTNIDAIDDFSPEELAQLAVNFDVKAEHHPKLIGIMIYIRKRTTEKLGRVKSFEAAFPERCIAVNDPDRPGKFAGGMKGEPLSTSAIEIKSKRLESSQLYLKVYQVLQSNLYISFAVDRFRVIQEALDKCLDPLVSDRDKAPYMKIFLEETRKPEETKGIEFNLNVTNNDISVVSVEEKLSSIADKMKDMSAGELVQIMHQERPDE